MDKVRLTFVDIKTLNYRISYLGRTCLYIIVRSVFVYKCYH